MFTKETYAQIKLFFSLTKFLSNLPIKYDHKSHRFSEIQFLTKIWYFAMLLWLLTRGVYHLGWALSNFVYGFPSVTDTTMEIFYGIAVIAQVTLNFGVYLYRTEFISHLTNLLLTNDRLSAQFLGDEATTGQRHWKTGKKFNDGCALYMRLLTPGGVNTGLTFGMLFLIQLDKRLYYYSFIPGNKPLWLTILYFLWECYTVSWGISILYLVWYASILYTNSCSFWMDQITNLNVITLWTSYPLHRTSYTLKIYKWMQMITVEHNKSVGGFLLAVLHAHMVVIQVVGVFVVVKFHNELPIPFAIAYAACAVIALFYDIFCVPVYGDVYRKSKRYLRVYDAKSLVKEWRMMKRALPALGVNVGGRYVLMPQTALTFISLGMTLTANLLVSTN